MKRNYFILLLFLCINPLSAQEKIDLFFDFDKDIPNEKSTQKLNNWLESIDSIEVTKIEGYCDFVDTDEYNKDLSLRRANSVLSTLKSNNFNVKNAEIIGFGENFQQSKVQSENRKAIVYYKQIKKPEQVEPPKDSKLSKQITESKVGEKLKLENLNFYNHSDIVRVESRPILEDLLQIMKANENLKIEIHGHICCMLDDSHQIALLRAKMVYNFLIQNGINKNRLGFKSFGSAKPIYPLPEKNEEERDANRRVEIMVISK
ncbi:outer membrane protein OmpA-like peptidoglycan-associated protein [Flavobacterium arsenatis]|uniref:Outer membrane protein OmpA-like peptidoglycan-associated protein n=1 Tax=Flavobacterium arsenatis TaxID=1484332 RepID=A0ABU1TQZ2_9FLAO|nr:OmpA family protein [Flavobacterium arsenatis]MDR6968410.1 outer membrane protein OmpA-like peptidoglycan-associated protein [Flavobacterium arsenatis]